ncbi:hypothetical protein NHQ30_006552 [Ciborinia camelliae]|nr:hypothetical protein NHQ30_006552 [Ciborinia camelliae]
MARILAPIVYYTDAEWRALKSKAKNKHPSLKSEDIEIINEVIRVYDAIVNKQDPTPLPQFASSIKMDERQVVKFFLWGTIEKCGGIFTLIRTFYLPKRRPDGRGGKHQKPAEMVIRPRRDSTGNTNGFVRRPERKDKSVVDENTEKGGETKGVKPQQETNGETRGNLGEKRVQKNRGVKRARHSNTFVRRSERRIGGAAVEKIVVLDGEEIGTKEDVREVQDRDMAVDGESVTSGDIGTIKDRGVSTGLSDSGLDDLMTSHPPAASHTNNTHPSPFNTFYPPGFRPGDSISTYLASANRKDKVYVSPFSIPLPSDQAFEKNGTIDGNGEKDINGDKGEIKNGESLRGLKDSSMGDSMASDPPAPTRTNNTYISPYNAFLPPEQPPYTSPYGPISRAGNEIERGSESTVSAESGAVFAIPEERGGELKEIPDSQATQSADEMPRADASEPLTEPSDLVAMDWEA